MAEEPTPGAPEQALEPTLLKWLWQESGNGKKRSARISFDAIDVDGNGALTFEELRSSEQISSVLSEAEIEQLIKKFDDNKDGQIQFEEFQHMWSEAIAAKAETDQNLSAREPAAQFVVRDKLKLRQGASMKSEAVGHLEAGLKVVVLEWSPDGQRAQVARVNDAEVPVPLGWASVFAKDGFENLLPATRPGANQAASGHALASRGARHRRATITETILSLARSNTSKASSEATDGMSEEQKHQAWLGAVRRCVLLQHLPPAELNFVSQARREIHTAEGETLYTQGDPISQGLLYIVASGTYRVTIETAKLGIVGTEARTVTRRSRDYGPQENFGACEMLCNDSSGRRTCTVVVHKPGMLWCVVRRIEPHSLETRGIHGAHCLLTCAWSTAARVLPARVLCPVAGASQSGSSTSSCASRHRSLSRTW